MSKPNPGWREVAKGAFTYEYSFGPDLAKSFAVKGPEGFVLVSPPSFAPDTAFSELEAMGPVAALVASNAFHHLGLPPWAKRFPKAAIFAPAQAIARVAKKSGIHGIRPLSEAKALLGTDLELIDMPHYKTGEVLVRGTADRERFWYVTDVIMNIPRIPAHPIVGRIFKWTNSAPGLKLNGVAPLFMMKNKKAVYAWLHEELRRDPPSLLVACHGENLRMDPPGKDLEALFVP